MGSFDFNTFLGGVTNVAEDWAKKELGITKQRDAGVAPSGSNWFADNWMLLAGGGVALLVLIFALRR
jgi:hypothetical protein